MVVARHKECDICRDPVGYNNEYYTIKSKDFVESFGGSATIRRKVHICQNCFWMLCMSVRDQLEARKQEKS